MRVRKYTSFPLQWELDFERSCCTMSKNIGVPIESVIVAVMSSIINSLCFWSTGELKSIPVLLMFMLMAMRKYRHLLKGQIVAGLTNIIALLSRSKDVIMCLCLINNIELYCCWSLWCLLSFAYPWIMNYLGIFSYTEINFV